MRKGGDAMLEATEQLFRGKRGDQAEGAAHDDPAEEIFRRYGNAMFHIARRILPDDGEAEDAVMDALEKVCANPAYYENLRGDERGLKLVVMRIVENAALDRWRKRRKRQERETLFDGSGEETETDPDDALSDAGSSLESAEEAYFSREELEGCGFGSVGRAVRTLPEKYREVLLLRYGEEYGNREIAAMLGIPESTVASRLMRARNMLRKKIRKGE